MEISPKERSRLYYLSNKEKIRARVKEYREKHRTEYLATSKRYYERNKDRINKQCTEWRRRRKDRAQAISRKWREQNLEKAQANEQAYRDRNRKACNDRIKEWKINNPGKRLECGRRRFASETKATPPWANIEVMQSIYDGAATLRRDSGGEWHVDHAIPVRSKRVCGLHCEFNLQIIPGKENMKKGNRTWPDMP